MNDHQRNLELKVRCSADDLAQIRSRLETLLCTPVQRLHQVDTYLRVDHGRLKLRELRSDTDATERVELIAYARPTNEGPRWSTYEVVPISANAAAGLLRGLLMTHEQLTQVDKLRHVAVLGQTRIHLDEVVGLGSFIELETVITTQGDDAAAAEHQQVIATLGLDRYPSIAGSYSDLILAEGMANGAG